MSNCGPLSWVSDEGGYRYRPSHPKTSRPWPPGRNDPTGSIRIRLSSGEVLVLGSASRLAFHGVDRIYPGTSSLLPEGGRINLTLRRVKRSGPTCGRTRCRLPKHDPEKWEPVFGKDHAQNKMLEWDGHSTKNHPALGAIREYA